MGTRILDAAFLTNSFDNDISIEVGNNLCEEQSQDDSMMYGMMMSSVKRTGDDDVMSIAAGSQEDENRRMVSMVTVNSGTQTPSMDRSSADITATGKNYQLQSNNFTCAAKRDMSYEVGQMSSCLGGNDDVETTPLLSKRRETIDDVIPKSPCLDVKDDNGGGGGIQSLCDPGKVVASVDGCSTRGKPVVDILRTGKNFTCSAMPAHQVPGQGYGGEFSHVNTCQG